MIESLKDKTAKGLFWGGLSTFIQQVIGMVFGVVIARILDPNDYGLVAMLAIFSAIANTIMDSGFTTALINKKTIQHEDYNAVFWFSIFCGIVIYVILFFAAPFIAQFYDKPVLLNLSRVLFLSFLISSFGIAHNAILFKKMKVKQRGFVDIVAVLISGIIGLVLALFGFAYWGLALQLVSQCFVATLLRWYFSGWHPTLTFDLFPIKDMFGFSSKILFNSILGQINANIFSVLLGRFYTEGDTGYYAQGNKWMLIGNMTVTNMIQSVAQPVLVEVQGDKIRQKNVFRKMLRFGAFVSFPALLGLAFVAKEFILVTVGQKWFYTVPYLQILCIMASFGFIGLLYCNLLYSYGKSNIILYASSLFYCVNMLLGLLLVHWGIYYLIIGCSILTVLMNLLWHFCGQKLLDLTMKDLLKDISPYFFLSVFVIFIINILVVNITNMYILLMVKVLLFTIFYILFLWICKSLILRESIEFFLKKIK